MVGAHGMHLLLLLTIFPFVTSSKSSAENCPQGVICVQVEIHHLRMNDERSTVMLNVDGIVYGP